MISALLNFVFAAVLGDIFGFGEMSSNLMFGLKIVALVMLYGYMHMNLGGGMLSTAVFMIFGYFFIFYANGMLAILVLVLFFVMMHGFDMLWGGDIVRSNVAQIMERKRMTGMQGGMQEQQLMSHVYRPPIPP